MPSEDVDATTNISDGKEDAEPFSPATDAHTEATEEEDLPAVENEVAVKDVDDPPESKESSEPIHDPVEPGKSISLLG